jgi:formate--tetrahydrofolate ligase
MSSDWNLPTDYEIAQATTTRPIADVAADLGLAETDLTPYGDGVAKLTHQAVRRVLETERPDGRVVLVTGMTPTPRGEGKTVTSIGLGQALHYRGHDSVVAVREPSLGPVFGIKGGAAGGGHAQVVPMEDINLHFTGDIHALTAAHNLVAATLDNHLSRENELDVDVNRVQWPRALDVDDRALREVVVGLGGSRGGTPRESAFVLTSASELMAILCLADDLADLKDRVADAVVAYSRDGDPVTVEDLNVVGAVAMLLKDAIRPNLVQTLDGVPAFVHGGPFANIAHGTNSRVADELGRRLGDYLVTEAGFGSDLGAEKFMNIVAPQTGLVPDAVVLVATVRALKYHGYDMWPVDYDELDGEDVSAVRNGLANLGAHVDHLRQYGVPVVVAVNRFPTDTDGEVEAVLEWAEERGLPAAESTSFRDGARGSDELAARVEEATAEGGSFEPLYDAAASLPEKIRAIATRVYGADDVEFSTTARDDVARLEDNGFDDLPVCVSKTFHSLSDDSSAKGVPADWTLGIESLYVNAGAGFVVALTDTPLTMPGLPAKPAAEGMDIDDDGTITGLF